MTGRWRKKPLIACTSLDITREIYALSAQPLEMLQLEFALF